MATALLIAELARLSKLRPPLYLMGGIAEEARLLARLTPNHADLDALALPEHWRDLAPALAALGYSAEPRWPAHPPPGRAVTLFAPAGSLPLEIWVAVSTAGGYALDLPGEPTPRLFRLSLPPDTFAHPPLKVAGLELHTIAPHALYLLRAASARTRGTPVQHARDRAMMARLRRACLAGLASSKLRPSLIDL